MFGTQPRVQWVRHQLLRVVAAVGLLLAIAMIPLLSQASIAQGNLKSRLLPITAPVKHAGVYHVATGTWTRNASLSNLAGPNTIYNNTCAAAYYTSQNQNETFAHRSCVPSPSHPVVPSGFYPHGNDEAPGCRTSQVIEGFQIGYCILANSPTIDYQIAFANSYTECADADMAPNVVFTLTLPGGVNYPSLNCWVVDIDLQATSQTFVLQADGDGSYVGPSTLEQFGSSWTMITAVPPHSTGPVIAGDYNWTGGSQTGPLTPCRGTDGTLWDAPVNLAEFGTGMASNDFFRVSGLGASVPPGCWSFGEHPHADLWLKLYANPDCPSPEPMSSFCTPGVGGVIACPCSNPPAGPNHGCNNFEAFSGGSQLSATGMPTLGSDTLVFTASGENTAATTIFLQSRGRIPSGVVFGAGVRCVINNLKRLYTGNAVAGTISRPRPSDPTVSQRSAQLGDPILPGEHRYYMAYYRDPQAAGLCGATATFNGTQSGDVLWGL